MIFTVQQVIFVVLYVLFVRVSRRCRLFGGRWVRALRAARVGCGPAHCGRGVRRPLHVGGHREHRRLRTQVAALPVRLITYIVVDQQRVIH